MYDSFYGFSARPFQLTPDARFWYETATHRTAMSYLAYGLAQGEGFIVVTGEVGSGKTTLVGHVMDSIDPSRLTAARLVSTQVADEDLLRLVADSFGIAVHGPHKADVLAAIEQFLHDEARAGRRCLLIVDECQNLPVASLEELRMLSNFQLGEHSLLQIFLLGQPEFRGTMAHAPETEQLRQRVIANHHLEAMLPEEVEPYVIHRLSLVGWREDPVIAPDVFPAIWNATGGIPRKVNMLVSRLLLHGAVEEAHELSADDVAVVVEELQAATRDVPVPAAVEPVAPTPAPEPAAQVAPAPAASAAPAAPASPPLTAAALAANDAPPAPIAIADPRLERQIAAQARDIADLREQLAALDAKNREQDAAIRRVLTLLIDWAERDPDAPSVSRGFAA
jgi:putative secretion ATPase (PEP-CTERM system associated)